MNSLLGCLKNIKIIQIFRFLLRDSSLAVPHFSKCAHLATLEANGELHQWWFNDCKILLSVH